MSALLVVLIVGVVTIAATVVIRLGDLKIEPAAPLAAPITAERLDLPRDARVVALGRAGAQTGAEILILIEMADGREVLRSYDSDDGALRSETVITRSD